MSAQSIQQSHHFLTLLPSNHATFSASTVAPDTIPEDSAVLNNADILAGATPIKPKHKTRRSSSSATDSSSSANDKTAAPEVAPVEPLRKKSTFLSNH